MMVQEMFEWKRFFVMSFVALTAVGTDAGPMCVFTWPNAGSRVQARQS